MRYKQQYCGDMVRPVMKGYKMRCCDCGLVHVLDFFVVKWGRGHKVKFRVRRDNRATAATRRKKAPNAGTQRGRDAEATNATETRTRPSLK